MNLNLTKKTMTFSYGRDTVTIETGKLAKQADGSVLVSCGGTQVLVAVCSQTSPSAHLDFFPLMVDYKEKFYAAGKFLGGFFKREGRPSNGEILLMRMIDRPLRPMFPQGYVNETIITAQVLSYDEAHDPEILAGLGASAALTVSDVPFLAPVGFARVIKKNGQYIINPSLQEGLVNDLDIIVAGSEQAILMVEGEAQEVSESDMLGAIQFAHQEIKKFCQQCLKFQQEAGKAKRTFTPDLSNKSKLEQIIKSITPEIESVLNVVEKSQRQQATAELVKKTTALLTDQRATFALAESDDVAKLAHKAVEEALYQIMRGQILNQGKRIGGRSLTEVRSIEVEAGILTRVHGSSLFTRGETQVLGAVTLGGKEGEQMVDRMTGLTYDKFYLHYNFPPFSVGEARAYKGVGRREVGHGNLAERALKRMLPPKDFPYTVRVSCEVLESNGSSSMGSVCAGSMALMDAGVPLVRPVAGIAMGLIKEGEKFQILSDILGDEDHLGDMDFKVAGTERGITAIQMDIKITGINEAIMTKALEQARVGRLHILEKMSTAISVARPQYKKGVPLIRMTKIATDQIGALIGPGGKNIRAIQEEYKVVIECQEDGTIKVMGQDAAVLDQVTDLITLQMNGPAIGAVYQAKVVSLKEYGAFVDIAQGVSGLVHVSEISDERVNDVAEYLSEGDTVSVKVMEVDRFGKVRLSIKACNGPLKKKV